MALGEVYLLHSTAVQINTLMSPHVKSTRSILDMTTKRMVETTHTLETLVKIWLDTFQFWYLQTPNKQKGGYHYLLACWHIQFPDIRHGHEEHEPIREEVGI